MAMEAGGWSEFDNVCNEVIAKYETSFPLAVDFSGFPKVDWDYGLPVQESLLGSLTTMEGLQVIDHLSPPMYYHSLVDALRNSYLSQDCQHVPETKMRTGGYVGDNNELGAVVWNSQIQHQSRNLLQQEDIVVSDENEMREVGVGVGVARVGVGKKRARKVKDEQICSSKVLTRKMLSHYFYMLIAHAAKELNIGLTLLKKRCRELGICRWPHRKLMSLQTLISNVQELGKQERDGSKERLKMAVEELERERKMMEELPDMQLEDKTKKLRQACFKANYKKRRMMAGNGGANNGGSSAQWNCSFRSGSGSCITSVCSSFSGTNYLEEDDEMRSLLSDCFSSSDSNSLLL